MADARGQPAAPRVTPSAMSRLMALLDTARRNSGTVAWIAFVLMLALAGVFLLHEIRGTTFRGDEWSWILFRRGHSADTFLQPHNEHFQLIPIAIYRVLFATAGLHDYAPYRVVGVAAHLGTVTLLFVYARRRVGDFVALLAAALLLFFGPGWENIFWPFQIAWLITVSAGLGALLLLEHRRRLDDVAASVLVMIALASSGVGIAVAAGVAVDLLWRRPRRDAWIVAVPAALYALWWVTYQNSLVGKINGVESGGSSRVAHSAVLLLGEVAQAAAGALAGLAGLSGHVVPERTGTILTWGPALLVVALGALAWWRARYGPFPRRALAFLAMLVAFWVLIALSGRYLTAATVLASRYVYVGAFLVILLAVELGRGRVLGLRGKGALTVVVALAVLSNVGVLRDAGRYLRDEAQVTKAEVGALNLARPAVKPGQPFDPQLVWYLSGVRFAVDRFYAAEYGYGSLGASPHGLPMLSERARATADHELVRSYQIGFAPRLARTRSGGPPQLDAVVAGTATRSGGCVSFRRAPFVKSGQDPRITVTVPPGGLSATSRGGDARVTIRRFALGSQPLGTLSGSARGYLRIRRDASPVPWRLTVAPSARLTLCGLR